MFIPIYNLAKFRNPTDLPKIAEVINNNDPKRIGRIKVKLDGLYDPIDIAGTNLPWIRRQNDTFLNGSDMQMFSLPEVGDKVELIWPYDNKHAFYRGIPNGDFNNTNSFSDAYGQQAGFKFGNLLLRFDKSNQSIEITNNLNFVISADMSGEITIKGGSLTIDTDFDLTINAPNVNIEGNLLVNGALTTSNGADGFISMVNIATVSSGIVTNIE